MTGGTQTNLATVPPPSIVPRVRRRVIVMLKFPTPGSVKTRLIPALGAERACKVHRDLVAQTQAAVAEFLIHDGTEVEYRVAGAPDDAAARAWLGRGPLIRPQGEGDLGARLERAVAAALAEGIAAVVVIGGDCPALHADHLSAAFAGLHEHDLVLGPATDGGYYLIGLRRPQPELFRDIAWGGPEVRAQTLAAARSAEMTVELLEPLSDVDLPSDLPGWAQTAPARARGRGRISVIIPTLNEAPNLPATLVAAFAGAPHEVIVADGGSGDGTPTVARAQGAVVLNAPRGRARQLNAGAATATGAILLFVHADTRLPVAYGDQVHATLARSEVVAGAFAFALDADIPGRRWIEWGTNRRARDRELPYGDQGLFLTREQFDRAGGFPDLPLLEDYVLVRRLRRHGRIGLAPAAVITSARRWRHRGFWRTLLLNQAILAGYHLGISPARLARWYRGPAPRKAGNIITPSPL